MRLEGKELKSSLAQMEKELAAFAKPIPPKTLNLPGRFSNIPRHRVTDFTADMADCYKDVIEMIDAPDAESGIACRLTFPNKGGEDHRLEKYKLPIIFGIYSPTQKKNLWAKQITSAMVKPGFHWYKLGQCRLSPDALMFLTWSWYATFQVNGAFDPNCEDAEYEVWISAKFTGPDYPGGRTDEPNAIYFERVCLIRIP